MATWVNSGLAWFWCSQGPALEQRIVLCNIRLGLDSGELYTWWRLGVGAVKVVGSGFI